MKRQIKVTAASSNLGKYQDLRKALSELYDAIGMCVDKEIEYLEDWDTLQEDVDIALRAISEHIEKLSNIS